MGSKHKVNHVNFSYLFSVSILSLFAIFLTMMVPSTKDLLTGRKTPQQFEISGTGFNLEPSEKNIVMPVSSPEGGWGINVYLKDSKGNYVLDQTNINYQWLVADPSIIDLYNDPASASCDYTMGKITPCPNLHASLKGLKPGSTTITVKAILTEQIPDPNSGVLSESQREIAATIFNIKVISEIPKQALINYKFKFKGVNKQPNNTLIERMIVNLINPENSTGSFGSYTNDNHTVSGNNDNTFLGYFYLDRGYFGRSNYRLCLKGLKHLQKCFDNIYISYDDNQFLDFSGVPLEPGDLSLPQNSWVDNNDLTYLWDHRGSRDGSVLAIGDLNYDGVINMGDINLLLPNLGKSDDNL